MTEDQKQALTIAAEVSMKPFAALVERLFGGAVDQIGGEWEDRLKVHRTIRRLKLFAKMKDQLEAAGIDPRGIPEKLWVPALQAASSEDDESLQDKWASLLANAANPSGIPAVHPSFIQILDSMAPLDALVLDIAYKKLSAEMKSKGNFQIVFLDSKAMQEVLKEARENGAETSLENIVRLRLVEATPEWVDKSLAKSRPMHRFYMTHLGHDFYLACQPPKLQAELLQSARFGFGP